MRTDPTHILLAILATLCLGSFIAERCAKDPAVKGFALAVRVVTGLALILFWITLLLAILVHAAWGEQ